MVFPFPPVKINKDGTMRESKLGSTSFMNAPLVWIGLLDTDMLLQ